MKKYILKLLDADIRVVEQRINSLNLRISQGGAYVEYMEKMLKAAKGKLQTITRYRERAEKEL